MAYEGRQVLWCLSSAKFRLAGIFVVLTVCFLSLIDLKNTNSITAPSYKSTQPNFKIQHLQEPKTMESAGAENNISDKSLAHKKLPGIIGIGCKKCGTGAFRQFIGYHSRIRRTDLSETHYFDQRYSLGVRYYKSLLHDVYKDQIAFEKTPSYLINADVVPARILTTYAKENVSTPKFVMVYCNPVLRAYSDFSQAKSHPDDPIRQARVGDFESFDDYVVYALGETGIPTEDTLDSFYRRMEVLLQNHKLDFLLRGIYSYFIERWLRTFRREQFVFVDGDKMLTDPGEALVKAQKALGLRVELTPRNFVYVPEKGFYCMRTSVSASPTCLGHAKGNTRKLQGGATVRANISRKSTELLRKFYEPFMRHFHLLINLNNAYFDS